MTASARRRAAALPPEQRREVLIRATLPLLLEHGTTVSTRQIAEAAAVAEGTIFRVFPDKDSLIAAVVEAAFDPEPFETDLARIPSDLDLEQRLVTAVALLQRRVSELGRLMAAVGLTEPPDAATRNLRRPPATSVEAIARLFEADRHLLRRSPIEAATVLRAMTIAATHPMVVDEPLRPSEIVDVVLYGLLDGAAPCASSVGRDREAPPC